MADISAPTHPGRSEKCASTHPPPERATQHLQRSRHPRRHHVTLLVRLRGSPHPRRLSRNSSRRSRRRKSSTRKCARRPSHAASRAAGWSGARYVGCPCRSLAHAFPTGCGSLAGHPTPGFTCKGFACHSSNLLHDCTHRKKCTGVPAVLINPCKHILGNKVMGLGLTQLQLLIGLTR